MLGDLIGAMALIATPDTILSIVVASFFGFVVGALPGLTATMAVALLIPITFLLSPVAAIASIVSAAAMSIFAGDIPGALLRIPGTPASAAYMTDANALVRKGEASFVIGASAVFGMIGGVIGTVILIAAAPLLADFALSFSSFEFFWLGCLGLSCAVLVAGDDLLKGMGALMIGLLIACVGMDYTTGYPRFTFGSWALLEGISFIPALIGMFALPEILRLLSDRSPRLRLPEAEPGSALKKIGRAGRRYWWPGLRGSVMGTAIGSLPGAGADIAAWISVAVTRRVTREPEKWGKGHIEPIVAGGSANNAALAGAWIPALVFAIPGDTITAIAIGVLYLKGVNPGPMVFVENGQIVYAVFLVFFLANLMLLPFGWIAIRMAGLVLRVPTAVIAPTLLVLACLGAFAINNDMSGLLVMLGLGGLAVGMNAAGLPLAPAVLGIVMGRIVEQNLMQSLISTQGALAGFFERPASAVLGVLTIGLWSMAILRQLVRALRGARRTG
ncbi:tripartite tricarboxylate transporter permease [Rhodovulum sp. MB263]|uniref:tripartite tricarboxylate transporter permease n=1 Tax=Rhodovulum sp. (strain MB263) TaxID=308754 RepID=UPI0009B7D7F9|nr:tripartite tricarboxylate transporter permease [Rhodovulum sp. MB263]ARC90302.1 C4-dicarboxylate ABC transporter permease [Rhodovulum sp. MB263]